MTINMTRSGYRFGAAALSALLAVGPSSAAFACSSGFLANLACKAGIIPQSTAQAFDLGHAGMGSPLDRVPGAALTAIHPSLGMAYEFNQGIINGRPNGGTAIPFSGPVNPFSQPTPMNNDRFVPSHPGFGGDNVRRDMQQSIPQTTTTTVYTLKFTFKPRN